MPGTETIWILEDDVGMQFAYQHLLAERYPTSVFGSIADLTVKLTQTPDRPSLLIADLRLPDGFFLDVLTNGLVDGVPCIVVSSLDDMDVLRRCFALGAADYLTKPFAPNELALKVERLLARVEPKIILDARTFTVEIDGRGKAALTGKEFQILTVLHQAKTQVASRSELLDRVWGQPTLETKALDVHMHNLRRKIAPLGIRITYRRPEDYILERDEEKRA
jgi:DNA-binding response OmpR family regulator